MQSENQTRFDNIWKQNINPNITPSDESGHYECKQVIKKFTSQIDNIHKELIVLYLSQFNKSKQQLDDGIQKLNEFFLGGKNKYMTDVSHQCSFLQELRFDEVYSTWKKTQDRIMSSMKTVSVNAIIDTDITINNMEFRTAHKGRDTVYYINFMHHGNKTLHISVMNVTFERIYLSLHGNHMSAFAKNSIFITSGIKMDPKFHVNHQHVTIDNCTFLGYISYPAVAVLNTANAFVTNSRFQHLQCGPEVSVVFCHDSHLELRNVSVDGCVCTSGTIFIAHSNITASYVRVKNNRNYKQYDQGKLLRVDKSILHIDNSTFEGNLNNILMSLELSHVNINFCTFRNNNVKTAMGAKFGIHSYGFTTITNTIFANNTIKDWLGGYPGAIIDSNMEKVHLINVTLVHNLGTIVTCNASVIEMMSCEFTNNIILSGMYYQCNVTMTNSVFQGNNGSLFKLNSSNIIVMNSHFSDNLNPDSGGIFFEQSNLGTVSSLFYIDISFCEFNGNYAYYRGIIYVESIGSVAISNCQFYNNSATTGGIAAIKGSKLIIKSSNVYDNHASKDAGVFLLTDHGTLLIENTIFTNNFCGRDGGVIKANRNSTLNITNISFISNRASVSDGGAIYLEDQSSMVSKQCLFINNTAAISGGAVMLIDHSGYNDSESTFTCNIASDTGEYIYLSITQQLYQVV